MLTWCGDIVILENKAEDHDDDGGDDDGGGDDDHYALEPRLLACRGLLHQSDHQLDDRDETSAICWHFSS